MGADQLRAADGATDITVGHRLLHAGTLAADFACFTRGAAAAAIVRIVPDERLTAIEGVPVAIGPGGKTGIGAAVSGVPPGIRPRTAGDGRVGQRFRAVVPAAGAVVDVMTEVEAAAAAAVPEPLAADAVLVAVTTPVCRLRDSWRNARRDGAQHGLQRAAPRTGHGEASTELVERRVVHDASPSPVPCHTVALRANDATS